MSDPREFERALLDPEPVQRAVLARLLAESAATSYGRDHGFAGCRSYEDYAARVPAASYDDLEPYIDRIAAGEENVLVRDPVVYLATSSGTTGRKKYVVIQPGFLAETEQWMAIERHFLDAAHPEVATADELRYVNRVEGQLASGMPVGSVSGWFYGELERAGRYRELVPYSVYQLGPVVGRNYAVLRFALAARFGRMSAVNPSTLLLLAQRLAADGEALVRDVHDGGLRHPEVPASIAALAGRLPADPARAQALEQAIARDGSLTPAGAWPELRLLCCWIHAGAGLYRRDLERAFGPLPVWDYGYTSSEGRFTVTARPDGAGVPLITSVFLELRGAGGQIRPLFSAEEGEEGELLVTSSRGLYRYAMGDRVEVAGWLGRTPLLRFRGKTTAVASLTGEKLTEEHVVGAVERSLTALQLHARFFCLAAAWGAPPRYLLLLDPGQAISDGMAARLALDVERRLIEANAEYERKRETMRLGGVGVYLLEAGEFDRYQSRLLGEGRELARLKLPRISMDLDLVLQLRGRVIEAA
jgi:hypothetical protein